jgi:hypothetical protein
MALLLLGFACSLFPSPVYLNLLAVYGVLLSMLLCYVSAHGLVTPVKGTNPFIQQPPLHLLARVIRIIVIILLLSFHALLYLYITPYICGSYREREK